MQVFVGQFYGDDHGSMSAVVIAGEGRVAHRTVYGVERQWAARGGVNPPVPAILSNAPANVPGQKGKA